MGFEAFCRAIKRAPALVADMYEKVGAAQYRILDIATDFDCVGGIRFADDLGYAEGLMVSPAHLRQHFFPWLKACVELAHRKGKVFIFHTDGDVRLVLEDIIACGVDGLHPIEPKAMDIVELKRTVGSRIALCGNIDLGYTLTRGTPEEVAAEVRERIRVLAPGGGYVLGSSNSVPEYVPLENFNAMREACFRYGRYPISLS
jgi:uroporphyrinogen decarboxylase